MVQMCLEGLLVFKIKRETVHSFLAIKYEGIIYKILFNNC